MRERPRQGRGRVSLFRKVVSTLTVSIAAASAACALLANGGHFSGTLDILAHLAPIYAVVGALALLVAVCVRGRRRGVVAALGAIGVLSGALLIAPEWHRSTGPDAPAGTPGTIKIIQFNTLRSNTDIRRTADWLIAQRPDVVAISEARHDLRDMLRARTGWKTAGSHGTLIIFTPGQYVKMNRPKLPKGSKLTFVNATYASTSGEMEVVTTHLDWPTRPAFRRQPTDLEGVTSRLPGEPMLLLGDFNSTPWSHTLQGLDRSLGLIRRDRAVPTFPAQVLGRPWPLPFLPIDHIYAGPGWATVKVERGPWLGSDHYPLIVTLAPVAN